MEKILVTGGAGFVGSSLSVALKKDYPKAKVIAFDNLKRRGSELNLPRLKAAGIEFLHGDIRNPEDIEEVGGFDLIVECAAEPSVLAGYGGSPAYLIQANLGGTVHCLEATRKHKATFVFLSTSRVYPIKTISELRYKETQTRLELLDEQTVPGVSHFGMNEEFPLAGTRSMYGATKLSSELLFQEYLEMYQLKGVINRCGVLTGPWQMGKVDQGVVVLWMARHIFGGKLGYFGYGGTGKQVRDILHVSDLYDLIKLQLSDLNKHTGEIYNVGGGEEVSTSLCELTELARELTGNTIEISSVPETRIGDIPCYLSDCRKVQQATGWNPKRGVRDILSEISDWILTNQDKLKPILG